MYDKVKIWLSRATAGDISPAVVPRLDGLSETTDITTGDVVTRGRLGNLFVQIFSSGVSVSGSLAKYMNNGSNVFSLDRQLTALAIERLEDELHTNLANSKVTELEFGTNYLMKNSVKEYLPLLGEMPRFQRISLTPNSIRYEGRGRKHPKEFYFYDKLADAEVKRMAYPCSLNGQNLLRYELRLKGSISRQMKVQEITAHTLAERGFYRLIMELYQKEYFLIKKHKQIKENAMSEIKGVKGGVRLFFARLVSQQRHDLITDYINELKAQNTYSDAKNYSRLKKELEEIGSAGGCSVSDELIKELDNEVQNIGAYV